MVRAAVEEAAAQGRFVAAHAHGAEGIKLAIRAGVRSIEHGSLIDDEGIAMLVEHGTYLVADVYDGDWIDEAGARDGWPAETMAKNVQTTEAQRDGVRQGGGRRGPASPTAPTAACIRTRWSRSSSATRSGWARPRCRRSARRRCPPPS